MGFSLKSCFRCSNLAWRSSLHSSSFFFFWAFISWVREANLGMNDL